MKDHGLARRVTLEILETVDIKNTDIPRINALKEADFLLAIDDYGVAHSNGLRVAIIGPNFLKIDRDIIIMLKDDNTKEAGLKLVREAVIVAKDFNVIPIAEYVSDANILDLLTDAGVQYFQGEHFDMPQPLDKIYTGPKKLT